MQVPGIFQRLNLQSFLLFNEQIVKSWPVYSRFFDEFILHYLLKTMERFKIPVL